VIGSLKRSRWILNALTVVCFFNHARGLDPKRPLSQYVREQWITSRFPGGAVNAIGQTSDGYLWIGTDKGLVRFDGFTFTAVPLTSANTAANVPILQLLTDDGGKLWVRPQGADAVRQRGGKFERVRYGVEGASQITAVSKESGGEIVVADTAQGTYRFRGDEVQKLAETAVLPGSTIVISMAETSDGKIWMGTLGAGLFLFADGRATSVNTGLPDRKINCLLPVSNEELWVGTDQGLYRWNDTTFRRVELPSSGNFQVLSILQDRDANIWVGTARGLLRFNAQGVSFSDERELRGDGDINALFEDREGNLWIGGARGLGRIRDSAFVTYSSSSSVRDRRFERNGPIYVDREGRTWFAPAQGGLFVLQNGRVEAVKSAVPANDVVYSISGSVDEVWVGRQRGGLTQLRLQNGAEKSQTYTKANGLAQNSVYAVYESRDGSVWAGTLSGGVSRFRDGRFTTYTTANGLASNTVSSVLEARDGGMWFATSNGLSSFANGQWRTYTVRDGLPSENVHCLFEDSAGTLWSGTAAGIASLASGNFHTARKSPNALREPIYGIAEDKHGSLWIATSGHVLQVSRDKLMAGDIDTADVREYGSADGLPGSGGGINRSRSVIADSEGRIWFSLSRGLSVTDPSHLANSSPPAIAHIESVSADGTPINSTSLLRVPASQKRITFAYTGLSLAIPERVRFRYFLDSFDRTWSSPVAEREAVYTNLGPGSYRFRVVASNSYGEWNGAESTLTFEVAPAFWQTWWFRSSLVIFAAFTALFFYRLHMYRVTEQLNVRFEERLAERMRIAQELHDTLLQGFLSASMQLHVAEDQLPESSPAKPLVGRVLELMKDGIEESRHALRGLRSPSNTAGELHQAFSRVPEELGSAQTVHFQVIVEGQSRPLSQFIRDDVYRMGREALVNAFRHARAKSIQVQLEYGTSQFRVLVRDDGCGIDDDVLRAGRDGHWGLPGMRERAEKIGARLRLSSRPAYGTEVELSIPARIAFVESSSLARGPDWLARFRAPKLKAPSDTTKRVE